MDEEERIAFVLSQFQAMGMTDAERPEEEHRLRTDAVYYTTWCANIHEWCSPCPVRFIISMEEEESPKKTSAS